MTQVIDHNPGYKIVHDHVQLTLLNWDVESVLALNKKTESELEISVFYLVPKVSQLYMIRLLH